MIEHSHIQKFAAVIAEAVLTYLDSGEPQWVTWDGYSHRFDFTVFSLDAGDTPAMLMIDENWPKAVGDVAEIIDPEHPEFDIDALRNAIEAQIMDEGYGERLLKVFQERLERIRSGEIEDDQPDEPDET